MKALKDMGHQLTQGALLMRSGSGGDGSTESRISRKIHDARSLVKEKHELLKAKEKEFMGKIMKLKRSATVGILGKRVGKTTDDEEMHVRPWEFAMLLSGSTSGATENDGHASARSRGYWSQMGNSVHALSQMGHRLSHAKVLPTEGSGTEVQCGSWQEEVRNALIGAGLIIAVHDVVKHGRNMQLVLINASVRVLRRQANRRCSSGTGPTRKSRRPVRKMCFPFLIPSPEIPTYPEMTWPPMQTGQWREMRISWS